MPQLIPELRNLLAAAILGSSLITASAWEDYVRLRLSRKLQCLFPRTPLTFLSCPFSRLLPRSRFAALSLKVHDRMTGMFLALAGFGKEAVHVMSVRGGERVFDAPDFLEHHVTGRLFRWNVSQFAHFLFPAVLPVCKSPEG